MNKSNPTTIIQSFLDAENKRDWQRWLGFIDPNVEYQVVGSEKIVRGKKDYCLHMKKVYAELADWHFNIIHMVSKSNVVVVEFDGKGHFSSEHNNKRYSKIALRLNAVCVFELENGKIRKIREYWDPLGYEKQLKSFK